MPLLYSIGLVILFYALVVAEFLVPSGGVLGIAAAVSGLTSILIAFTHSTVLGWTVIATLVVTTPMLCMALVRIWPITPMGRRMLNRDDIHASSRPPILTTRDGVPLEDFVGKLGVATSDLLPSGEIEVDGHRLSAVSLGLPIDVGATVKVARLYGRKLQVQTATAEEANGEKETRLPDAQEMSRVLDQVDLDEMA